MANLQRYFNDFHDRIKCDEDDENLKLREKRDLLIEELRAGLRPEIPAFEHFHQGSYAIGTGIVPKDGNFDIDIGLLFDCDRSAFPNPVDLKVAVRDALLNGNRTVRIRRPCVTVEYMRDGKPIYHVDFAVYVKRTEDSALDLAVGREDADEAHRGWERSDPFGLVDAIKSRHSGDAAAQFRGMIRYLKCWRDERFSSGGAPKSIVLTSAAYHWFEPRTEGLGSTRFVDSVALLALVNAMLARFVQTVHDQEYADRLVVILPVEPRDDLLASMTNAQMAALKFRLEQLRDALRDAIDEPAPEVACATLAKQFGDRFPVPAKEETAKATAAPYVSTGASA